MSLRLNERGALNVLLIPLIVTVMFFFGTLGFAAWAFMGRQDYKNNVDPKIAAAVAAAVEKTKTEKDNEFVQREKEPLREYVGPVSLGSVTFKYPKTWSGYYTDKNTESMLIMHPKLVPGNDKSLYALRVEVVSTAYDKVLQSYESSVKSGKLTAEPYRLELLQEVEGVRINGELSNGVSGSMVILPLRDKTLKISTESEEFTEDFDGIILKNFTFSP